MKRWPNKVSRLALIAAGAAAIVTLPAIGQDAPESLLPPGFGDPVAPPPPSPPAVDRPTPTPGPALLPSRPTPAEEDDADENEEDEEPTEFGFLLPSVPVAPLGNVGPLALGVGGMGPGAFGDADGVVLSRLMRRLDAPLPSRWASILLRRALLSEVPTPRGVAAPDWVAERAWLLLRMGEADSARLLVQAVHPSQYTPKLYDIAMQVALALGDPGALCPIVDEASAVHRATGWLMARGMCAGLAGEPGTASATLEQARRTRLDGLNTIDLLLAEKVAGAGINSRRTVTIEWEGVERLTAWRYGLASATGVEIPAALFATVGPHVQGWRARAPFLPDSERIAAGRRAAALGVLSSAALVDLYSGVLDRTDVAERAGTPPVRLRDAYTGDAEARLDALREIWNDGEDSERFASLILTARAAARIPAVEENLGNSALLLASMLTAGLDTRALAWSELVESDGDQDSWGLLALGSPDPQVTVSAARARSFAEASGDDKARFLIAGLAGLGRISAAEAAELGGDYRLDLTRATRWTRLLDRAVANRQLGTVTLLAAIGMQTSEWGGVPPEHLYRIVAALRQVGLEPEARMIATEALIRA